MQSLTRGRRVGIDFGQARIGVAVSDFDAILVSPVKTLPNDATLTTMLTEIFKEYDPIYIAIGNPIHLSGADSEKAKMIRSFALSMRDFYTGKIYLVDERLSTNQSISQLHEMGKNVKNSKSFLDQMAAVNILNQALQLEASEKGLGDPL
jgi:putative Holliday junction resolvase